MTGLLSLLAVCVIWRLCSWEHGKHPRPNLYNFDETDWERTLRAENERRT